MKFVIQHHTCYGAENADHYDLMIEQTGGILATWQIEAHDFAGLADGCEINAKRIADHRNIYLTYEGPVSGNRGHVKIYDTGEAEAVSRNEYMIRGNILYGRLNFERGYGDNNKIVMRYIEKK